MAEALRAAGFPLLASKLSGETPKEDSNETTTTWGPDDARIIFTAYFEGTANVVERRTTQIDAAWAGTAAEELRVVDDDEALDEAAGGGGAGAGGHPRRAGGFKTEEEG